ncbi:hypothetical protein [Pedobacter sp.]
MFYKLKYLFCFAFLLLSASTLYAQQNFTVTGVLFEKGTTLRIALAEVKNKRTGFSAGSNDIGLFTIKATIGDTLSVTKRNFSDLQVVIRDTKDLVLYLNKGTMLNEVVVTGQTKKQALNEVKKDFRNKGSFYGGKPPLLSFIFSPLTAFYELFGRTPKQARRFNTMYQNEMQDSHVDQYYNKTLINQQTGLSGKELEDFLVNYRPTYDQAKNWNVYDGIKWINDSYKKYSDTAGKAKSN